MYLLITNIVVCWKIWNLCRGREVRFWNVESGTVERKGGKCHFTLVCPANDCPVNFFLKHCPAQLSTVSCLSSHLFCVFRAFI